MGDLADRAIAMLDNPKCEWCSRLHPRDEACLSKQAPTPKTAAEEVEERLKNATPTGPPEEDWLPIPKPLLRALLDEHKVLVEQRNQALTRIVGSAAPHQGPKNAKTHDPSTCGRCALDSTRILLGDRPPWLRDRFAEEDQS